MHSSARTGNRPRRWTAVFLLFVLLPGLARAGMLDARDSRAQSGMRRATLYFRYRTTDLLAREERELTLPQDSTEEMALVQALVEGPDSLSPHLSPLFPPGTQVLHITQGGGTLFVTFNETLMNRYPDEPAPQDEGYDLAEARLRRRLAMAGLVNTLTESGRYSQVQVLVRQENYISTSMRLSSHYYLEEEEGYPPPLVRQEEYVHSPQATAERFMRAWQEGDIARALPLVRGSASSTAPDQLPGEYELLQAVAQAPRMVQYALTPGVVALDGQSAVVSVSYRLLDTDGQERLLYAHPLRLLLREGIFVIPYEAMMRLLELDDAT